MERKNVYITMDFWDGFIKSRPDFTPFPEEDIICKGKIWYDLYLFIRRSNLGTVVKRIKLYNELIANVI